MVWLLFGWRYDHTISCRSISTMCTWCGNTQWYFAVPMDSTECGWTVNNMVILMYLFVKIRKEADWMLQNIVISSRSQFEKVNSINSSRQVDAIKSYPTSHCQMTCNFSSYFSADKFYIFLYLYFFLHLS